MVNKRMPADTTLKELTFLNDKKIDGELYALLQSYSVPNEQKQTIVNKKDLPSVATMNSKLGIKSRTTFYSHLKYLKDRNFIVEKENFYYLPNQEEIYFMLPLDTLKFLNDTSREQVIKVYLYLGQRWKYKSNDYIFTIEEIAKHIGIKLDGNSRNYEIINNALVHLKNNGLIDYTEFYEGDKPRKRLINFSLIVKNLRKEEKIVQIEK